MNGPFRMITVRASPDGYDRIDLNPASITDFGVALSALFANSSGRSLLQNFGVHRDFVAVAAV